MQSMRKPETGDLEACLTDLMATSRASLLPQLPTVTLKSPSQVCEGVFEAFVAAVAAATGKCSHPPLHLASLIESQENWSLSK